MTFQLQFAWKHTHVQIFLSFHSSVIFPNVCHSVAQEWHIFDNCSNIFSFFHISSFHFLRWICSVLVWWFPAGQKPFCICLPFNSCNLLKYEKKKGLFVEKMWSNLSYYFSQVPGCGLQISCLFSCHTSDAFSQGKQSKYCMSSKIEIHRHQLKEKKKTVFCQNVSHVCIHSLIYCYPVATVGYSLWKQA